MSINNDQPDLQRRNFIGKTVLAAGAATVAPGVMLTVANAGSEEGVSSDVRWGMLIDTNKCADGCTACVEACNKENGIDLIQRPEGQSDEMWDAQRPQWIRKVKLRDTQTGEVSNLPMMCQHCEHPPCVDVCPTGASFKRADGIVMVDRHICIGCRYCMMACPYKARSFIHQNVAEQLTGAPRGKGCVESCNLCANRIDEGQETTACQDACNQEGHKAILFGDLKNPQSEIAQALKTHHSRQIRADLELNTGVRYTNV
ncbi:sulfate reduction electron transfer complex DsrMKJOP subunit DsrO [Sedimenticola thiotaurini]|uniref:4Fe-4S ferredoxin n=1 Tax=Sedimenticola thiotaurini TaxID=1543721 RepID=A0A0F7K2M0_9GAMM|nr:4Fe-4S dicluster domain-containing protein [Sedimenticola thiotaurini]AKH21814.1 4Fe-4S ferredoxin [Sedimenticola thiotaurini]